MAMDRYRAYFTPGEEADVAQYAVVDEVEARARSLVARPRTPDAVAVVAQLVGRPVAPGCAGRGASAGGSSVPLPADLWLRRARASRTPPSTAGSGWSARTRSVGARNPLSIPTTAFHSYAAGEARALARHDDGSPRTTPAVRGRAPGSWCWHVGRGAGSSGCGLPPPWAPSTRSGARCTTNRVPRLADPSPAPADHGRARVEEYVLKAVRGGHRTPPWVDGDDAHEQAVVDFATGCCVTTLCAHLDEWVVAQADSDARQRARQRSSNSSCRASPTSTRAPN